jgi:hypothetical protein
MRERVFSLNSNPDDNDASLRKETMTFKVEEGLETFDNRDTEQFI